MSVEIQGHLIVLIGPSGSGKNTLKSHVMETFGKQLCYPVSYTSRIMRPGEQEGETYYYISRDEFIAKRDAGELLEWVEYSGNFYGLPKGEVTGCDSESGIALVDVEKEGLRQILDHVARENISVVYISGGSWEGLRARIEARAPMPAEELSLREESYARIEQDVRPQADYVITNADGKVQEAYKDIDVAIADILDKYSMRVRMRP